MENKNIKYTTDGKKVVVIGDLNQTEKIVQEIFITEDGAEIPSGERFTTKSLHDAPVRSWKESRLVELEENYEKEKEAWNRKIENIQNEKALVYKSLEHRVKWLRQVAKQPHPEALKKVVERLAMFLSNTDMWVFYKNYSDWHLVKYDQDGFSRLHERVERDYGCHRIRGMRLVSIYGDTDGNFDFKMNEYGDGSGSDNDSLFYFKSKEEALQHVQNDFNALDKYDSRHIDIAKKFNLKVDEVKLKAYNDSIRDGIVKYIKEYKSKIEECEAELKNLD